jgi:transcriptional regulator with GAF, ATPase, and Fis domain
MSEAGTEQETGARSRLCKERDLYLGLLKLIVGEDPEPFLKDALDLITGIVGAERGYLELFDHGDADRSWFRATGLDFAEVTSVRANVSRGIIAEAVATEQVVLTPSAVLDPRFKDRASVKLSRIDAVICAPIGRDPPIGVLYLQGDDPEVFNVENVSQVELFASHLAPLANRLKATRSASGKNALDALRQRLNASDVVGQSTALAAVLHEVALVAPLDVGVLLQGATGTGKTQLARVIHRNSSRASGPFVELNCAALPEHLIESELFGAEPGAHSTATRRIEGKVAAASGGTLLLDEIAELSLPAQAKLLQFLQSKVYYPLGARREATADVRIIAATNVDLGEAVEARRFREDLFYRLQVISIRLPTLAERVEDVPLLARHFCEQARRTHRLPHVELSPEALRMIEASEWNGNMRELANAIERTTIRAAGQGLRRIEARELRLAEQRHRESRATPTFQEETRRFQAGLVARTLEATDWNVSEAARRLDLTRTHLYNLIKSFGLKRST